MNFNLTVKQLPAPKNINMTYPHDIHKLTLTWDAVQNPDATIVSEIRYNIYRSNSINGIYYKINSIPININRFEDITMMPNLQYWYKISTVAIFIDNTFSESYLSQPTTYQVQNENKWFKKINERNMWILKNTGVLMDLYQIKYAGEHCPQCWDPIRGQSENSRCEICFGTGIVDGYEPVNQLYVRQKPVNQQLDLTARGYMINSNPGAWTISSTKIHARDLLINPEGIIFSVTSANINHAAGCYFHQELQMKEIDPMDVRYSIKRITLYPEFK